MGIEVIPAGASAVVTENEWHHRDRGNTVAVVDRGGNHDGHEHGRGDHVVLLNAIKDAACAAKDAQAAVGEAACGLERSSGQHFGNTVAAVKDAEADMLRTVKDAEADLERSSGLHYGATVTAVKDAQASIERGNGFQYADTVKTIKDAEAQLDRASSDRFIQAVQDIKDAESRAERSAGTRFAQTVEDIKDAETRLDRASADRFVKTVEDVKNVEIETLKSKGKLAELIKESELEGFKAEARTRELLQLGFKESLLENCKEFDSVKQRMEKAERELDVRILVESKQAALERMMGFKDTQLQLAGVKSDLAAQIAECCCENKMLFAQQAANILADGQKTRDLINANEVADLREKLAEAKASLRCK